MTLFEGGKKKGGADEGKKEEAKKEEIKFDPITPDTLMIGKPFGKANKKFAKVSLFWWVCSLRQELFMICTMRNNTSAARTLL